jgi:hypothetical protein
MFAIYDKNRDVPRIVWGPRIWDKAAIQDFIFQRYNLDFSVPFNNPTEKVYVIQEGLEIWPVQFREKPSYADGTQKLAGPFYEYGETHIVEYHTVLDKDDQEILNDYKADFARRKNDIMASDFVTVEIQGDNYTFFLRDKTDLKSGVPGWWKLDRYILKDPSSWPDDINDYDDGMKFMLKHDRSEHWVELTQEEIDSAHNAITTRIQLLFNTEKVLNDYVDSLTSPEGLIDIPENADNLLQFLNDLEENTLVLSK